jgi:MFS family permease
MNQLVRRLVFWSAILIAALVILIDVGMIASNILYPITHLTNMEEYAAQFSSAQMLPFIPSLILAPVFVVFMLSIYHSASQDKKVLGQLGFSFALICAVILSLHYYIQLTVVRQGILSGEYAGLWQFVTPNPHSFFWMFAALGYGFMGFALLCATPTFPQKADKAIRWLFVANGVIGLAFLVGNTLGLFIINILVSFVWGALFPIAALLVAKKFRRQSWENLG